MSRRPRLGVLLLAALAAGAVCPAATRSGAPNIVVIYTDDQADWTVGAYGNPQAHTPHLDRLAAQGARLTNALVTTPVCSPARASFFTSRYGSELGIYDFIPRPGHKRGVIPDPGKKQFPAHDDEQGLDPKFITFPAALARAGYATALVGKFHLGDWTLDPDRRYHPTRFGFQYFMGLTDGGCPTSDPELEKDGAVRKFAGLTGDILTRDAIEFIERPRTQPFFLMLSLRSPHGAGSPWRPGTPRPTPASIPRFPIPTSPIWTSRG